MTDPSSDHEPETKPQNSSPTTGGNEPRTVLPIKGAQWLIEGGKLFFQYPGPWMAIIAFGIFVLLLSQLVPVVGPLFYYTTHFVWIAGLMSCCRAFQLRQPFSFQRLFDGFKSGTRTLMSLSLMYAVVSLSVDLYFMEPFIKQLQNPQATPKDLQQLMQNPDFFKAVLWSALTMLPIQMALVFTPALVLFQQKSLIGALQLSFSACMKNFPAVVVYLLTLTVLGILATLPALLGWLILVPAIIGSIYLAYDEIFEEPKVNNDYLVV